MPVCDEITQLRFQFQFPELTNNQPYNIPQAYSERVIEGNIHNLGHLSIFGDD